MKLTQGNSILVEQCLIWRSNIYVKESLEWYMGRVEENPSCEWIDKQNYLFQRKFFSLKWFSCNILSKHFFFLFYRVIVVTFPPWYQKEYVGGYFVKFRINHCHKRIDFLYIQLCTIFSPQNLKVGSALKIERIQKYIFPLSLSLPHVCSFESSKNYTHCAVCVCVCVCVVTKILDCNILVSEFKLQSCYYIHIWNNGLGGKYEPLYLSVQP